MFLGRVVGTVWSSVKWPQLDGMRLLLVRPYDKAALTAGLQGEAKDAKDTVVCADVLGAGAGEDVIIAFGHAARIGIENVAEGDKPTIPVDAAVVAIVDRFTVQ